MQMTTKKIRKELQDNKKIVECAERFGVTGDKTRLKICYLLCHYPELYVSQIAELVESPISTISHSLQKLKEIGIVETRRESKNIFYSLKDDNFVSLLKNQLV